MSMAIADDVEHPAPFSPAILSRAGTVVKGLRRAAGEPLDIWDPFGGIGRAHRISTYSRDARIVATEIEYEWARQRSHGMVVADCMAAPFRPGCFSGIFTSPSYGNRFADHHLARDFCKTCGGVGVVRGRTCRQCRGARVSRRRSYTHDLGRDVTANSSAILQWGKGYREWHTQAFEQMLRYLQPPRDCDPTLKGIERAGAQGGWLLLNISDHYRHKELQHVTDWYVEMLSELGLTVSYWDRITTSRMQQGENYAARAPYENLILLRQAA